MGKASEPTVLWPFHSTIRPMAVFVDHILGIFQDCEEWLKSTPVPELPKFVLQFGIHVF